MFSLLDLQSMGYSPLRPDHLEDEVKKCSMSLIVRAIHEKRLWDRLPDSTDWTSLIRSKFPHIETRHGGLTKDRFKELALSELNLKLYNYIRERQQSGVDLNCQPYDPESLIEEERPDPEDIYKVNLNKLVNNYRLLSIFDVLQMNVPDGLEEEHLEAVKGVFEDALQTFKGNLVIDGRQSRNPSPPLHVSGIGKPIAMAILMAIKKYIGGDTEAKVRLRFVGCDGVAAARLPLIELAKTMGIRESAIVVEEPRK